MGGMGIRVLRAVTLLLAALTMGLLFAHVLELGPKFGYPPELYVQLNNSLYAWYGPPLGALLYVGSIVTAGVLTWLVRRRRAVLAWTGTAAILQAAALVTYFAVVEPVNQRLRPLPPGTVPADFAALRTQWEFGHVTEFVLFLVAFVLLVVSVLRETDR
ncbi:MAG: hypothetical protein ACRDSF_10995 [Pseudonocardiaceae bacterium]